MSNNNNHQISLPDNKESPAIILLVISFFILVYVLFYRTFRIDLPSVLSVALLITAMIVLNLSVYGTAMFNTSIAWIFTITFTLILSLCATGAVYPDIFFFPTTS